MDLSSFERISECAWRIAAAADMRVPVIIYASEQLARDMDEKVHEQAVNVATLPGLVQAVYVMPDAHWGYGFPIGGVAAFAAEQGGVISAGGVGFDISCGVRTLTTGLAAPEVEAVGDVLASDLARSIPAGLGREGKFPLDSLEMDEMLSGGATWAVARGWGSPDDLDRIEEGAASPMPIPSAFRRERSNASVARWGRSVRATTTSRSRNAPRSSIRMRPRPSV